MQAYDEKETLVEEFFNTIGICKPVGVCTINDYIQYVDEEILEDIGMNKHSILVYFQDFVNYKNSQQNNMNIKSITIVGGYSKSGEKEDVSIKLKPGEMISIVGPTGSGKSRLLEDIEWIAQEDTPTRRKILINDQMPDEDLRFSVDTKLVAQLSQNMNFIMDTTVEAFIQMHAESRGLQEVSQICQKIITKSNELAGEMFDNQTPLTSLSGGQSRALMIADTAYLSNSPIVLIDEIENAGIDRRKAIELLVKNEKIIIMATHDPILALMAQRRVVIKNGGIAKVIKTNEKEREHLSELERMDRKLLDVRNKLRLGDTIEQVGE